ncbi:OmpP1/FadL family transporter [Calditrichota bacterium LG25]
MKRLGIVTCLSILFMLPVGLFANGLSLNSIGPKSLGMGGAFVGLADDYTALYWNPAGLIHLDGAYVGIFVTDIIPMATYKYDAAGIDTKSIINHYASPNLMGYWTCRLNDKLKMGLGVYVPAGLGVEWEGKDLMAFTMVDANGDGVPDTPMGPYEWMSKIGVVNLSPAISFKASEKLSLGLAVNIFYGMFDLKRPATLRDPMTGAVAGFAQYSESSDGLGYGVTLGMLYKYSERFHFGLSFRTKMNVTMSGEAENPGMAAAGYATKSDFDRDVAWPLWIGGGVAIMPTDKFTLTADLQWSQWKESEETFVTKFKDAAWKAGSEATGENIFHLYWENALQIRLGAEYKLNEDMAVRGGWYYDPAPAPDKTYNILFPSITYNAFTIGGSYRMGALRFDAGLEYLYGQERVIESPGEYNAVPGTHNMDIFAFSLGVGYQF